MKKEYSSVLLVAIVVFLSALMRIINAEFNFYHLIPIAALGLFSGSILKNKIWAYAIPLSALFLSDIGFALFTSTKGFYGISQIVNYTAIVLVTLLGTYLINRSFTRIAGFTVGGSLLFFLLSNFGTYLSGYYGFGFSSLTECYTMALPFYKNELATNFFLNSFAGDMLFSFLAFGLHNWFLEKKPMFRLA